MSICLTQGKQGAGALAERVALDGKLEVSPIFSEIQTHQLKWYRVQPANRMHPGATAPPQLLTEQRFFVESCEAARDAFQAKGPVHRYTISRNGCYRVKVGVRPLNNSTTEAVIGNDPALLLESLDQVER